VKKNFLLCIATLAAVFASSTWAAAGLTAPASDDARAPGARGPAQLAPAPSSIAQAGKAHPGQFGPEDKAYGTTYGDWTARWFQWLWAIPLNVDPFMDASATQAAINQQGPVWFVGYPYLFSNTTTRIVPKDEALLIGIANYGDDYPCPGGGFEPAPGQTLEDFLTADAKGSMDQVTVAEADLDGKDLSVDRVASHLFPFTAAADVVALDPCVTGSPQLAVSDGYWVFLKPLSPGRHTFHAHLVFPLLSADTHNTIIFIVAK
jgi:hypothetical protein